MRVKNLCSAKVLRSDEIAASSEAITNGTRGTALGIRKARKRSVVMGLPHRVRQ